MGHCIYCNSSSYGKPCIFSPTNTHVHFDDPQKCIYCGSKMLGGGCLFNPFGKNHVRGPEYLANVKEQTEKSAILSYLYENLLKDDSQKPLTPLSRFYKRLMGIITNASQPLLEALSLQSKPSFSELRKEDYIKVQDLKKKLVFQYEQLSETIKHAGLTIPQEILEDVVLDAIITASEKKA